MSIGNGKLATMLKRHPFPVVAWFERVVAISFAFPEEILRPLVPEPVEIDCHQGFGFVAVALVWTKGLRPAAFPRFMGQDFFLAGYRIFTRLETGSDVKCRKSGASGGSRNGATRRTGLF